MMRPAMPSHRRALVGLGGGLLGAILLLALASTTLGERKRDTPSSSSGGGFNIILVSADTLRADRLGCYGYAARPSSPNVDALARDAILFENFISSSPWTTPAHVSMLTSLQPVSHGLTMSFGELGPTMSGRGAFYQLAAGRTTLAEALKQHGFATMAFTAGGPLAAAIGFDQGFDEYRASMYKLNEDNVGEMLDWIKQNAGRRFFLFWHHFELHAPYLNSDFIDDVLPAEQAALVRTATTKIAKRRTADVWKTGALTKIRDQMEFLKENGLFTRDVSESLYVSGVRSADRWLGRLIRFLRDNGLYDDTMIVFTSDHGDEFSDRQKSGFYNLHGHTVYDEMVRVPLIVKLPGQHHAGLRVTQVTRMIDLMPTILELAGARPKVDEMEGISLARYWTSAKSPGGEAAIIECCARLDEKKSVRTDRHKYIVSMSPEMVEEHGREYLPPEPPRQELYDLARDPGERTNLLESDAAASDAELAKRFYRQLLDYLGQDQGQAEPTELDEETIEKLKSLGYVGE